MSGRACSSCRHWVPLTQQRGTPLDPAGHCGGMSETTPMVRVRIESKDSACAWVETRADFSCALWDGEP